MLLLGLLSLSFLLIYRVGIAPSVFGGDCGDIILSYFFAGVAHPPGYPLNTILGFLLTRIIPGINFAYRANFVSAIYLAFAVGLLYLLMQKLIKNIFISLACAATLGFVPLFWLYAHVAEVFQLAIVLILASLIFTCEWFLKPSKKNIKNLYLGVFFLGLAIFHHSTSLLLMPAYVYVFWETRRYIFSERKISLKIFVFFLLGALPYLFILWTAQRHTPLNWDSPTNLANFIRLLTRADYGTFTASQGIVGFSFKARLVQLLWYLKLVKADFGILGMVFIISGLVYLYFKKKDFFWFFGLLAFFTGPFFLFYASFPPVESFIQGVSERFVLLNYPFLAILLGFGMLISFETVIKIVPKFTKKSLITLLFSLIFLLFPFYLAIINWEKADLSRLWAGKAVADDLLNSADPAGIIFLQGDTLTFNSQYSYYVDKVNNASKIILTGRLAKQSYRQELVRQYSQLTYPANFASGSLTTLSEPVVGLIRANFDKFPIYVFEPVPLGGDFVWVQEGMLNRLYKKDTVPSSDELSKIISKRFSHISFNDKTIANQYRQFFTDNIVATYVEVFSQNGFELLKRNEDVDSRKYFELALHYNPTFEPAMFGLGVSYFDTNQCNKAVETFTNLTKIDENYWQAWEGLGRTYSECFGQKDKAGDFFNRSKEIRDKIYSQPIVKQ